MSKRTITGRRVASMAEIERPGDYFGPTTEYTGGVPAVFFLKPNSRDADVTPRARSVHHCCSPPHAFVENADGSLSIQPSISDTIRGSDISDGWHGYLDPGHIWRQV